MCDEGVGDNDGDKDDRDDVSLSRLRVLRRGVVALAAVVEARVAFFADAGVSERVVGMQ